MVSINGQETVTYDGKEVKIITAQSWSNLVTIEVDGQTRVVNKQDPLFNNYFEDNSSYQNTSSYYSKQLASYDRRIESNKEKIKKSNAIWAFAKNAIKKCRTGMNTILSEHNARNLNDIDDESARKEYLSLMSDKSNARKAQLRASADVLSAAIDTGSACSGKHNVLNQLAIFEQLA